ncbi:outer membrane lipoprotein carrier protein LolA [candidate division WOR-3 bacterium]|nr:outer membrane lipoprotein carrier protein LolA [candidate division WOR-3 bacterium]
MKKLTGKLVLAAMIFSVTAIRGGEAEDALAKMRTAWKAVSTYQVTMITHQTKASKTEDRTVKFSYKSPGWIRTDIIEGKNKGSTAVYDPDEDKIRAKQPGLPVITLSPDANLARGLRGDRIYAGSFKYMLKCANWYEANGSLNFAGTETVDNASCTVIEFKTSSPDANNGVKRERWWMDANTGFPRMIKKYDTNDSLVDKVILRNLKLNPGFTSDYFSL